MLTPSSDTVVPSRTVSETAGEARPVSSLQAVLWDMDGTIVDTEPYWIEAEYELVRSHGGSWSREQAEGLVGQALTFSARVLQEAGVNMSVRGIIDTLTQQVTEKVRESVPWRPGARELLIELREHGIPCALVTMSEQLLAQEVAGQLPEGSFRFLVTGDLVGKGKPDPEAYQLAYDRMAEHIPLQKDRVVAIEDSIPGVTSARAAGLVTLGVPHFVPLPTGAAHHEWSTLAGRGVHDLERLLVLQPQHGQGRGRTS